MTLRKRPTITAPSILALVQSIERHGPDAPAALAFRSALRRAGLETEAADGLAALGALLAEVVAVEPGRADARQAILLAAWAELLPGPPRGSGPQAS